MTTLADAKLAGLEAQTGSTGHVSDLEAEFLVSLGATPSRTLVDQWFEVFDNAAIPPGTFNDRFMVYMSVILALASSSDLAQRNDREIVYWTSLQIPAGAPPFFGNVQHWFDFNDASTLFTDVLGVTPIVPGGEIRRIDNKGSDGQSVISTATPGSNHHPFYFPDGVNNLGVGHGFHDFPNIPNLEQDNPTWLSGGNAAGISMFVVTRESNPGIAFTETVEWRSLAVTAAAAQQTSTTWRQLYAGNALDTLKPIVNNEWTWHYMVAGPSAGGIVRGRTAGTAEVSISDPYVPVGATGGPFFVASIKGDTAEAIIYDRELTPSELLTMIAYFDAKYGVMPYIAAPLYNADLLHHFDFTQNQTVFKNPPANQPAGDGDFIRVVGNLGTDETPLASASTAVAPIYRTGVLNGLNIADFSPAGKNLQSVIANGLAASTTGISFAAIARFKTTAPPTSGKILEWGPSHFWEWDVSPPVIARAILPGFFGGDLVMIPVGVIDTWYLMYMTIEEPGAVNDFLFGSPGPEAAAVDKSTTDIANALTMIMQNDTWTTEIAEIAIWDGPLNVVERGDLVAYADLKYGTLPITAPPVPALGNLLHHVDPGDASTVWADAAGTIPAVNAGPVLRIDNKGTRGTPLASATGTPIYRTGVLNGENVIEFSGARLEALAESPGLTVSTTGCTIAMVTRRRASHIGDSILWRWTPFLGTPGPSLRGKFSLNGNFGRADPIADEQLVADPATLDTWYLLYWSLEAGASVNDAKFGSPGPEVAGPFGDITDIPDLADVRFGTSSTLVEHAEAWFWDRPLTSTERAQLVAYADSKYGTLPHL